MKITTPLHFITAPILIIVILLSIVSGCDSSDSDDEKYVTCGSAIKLTHVESGGNYFLNSDERQLQLGSGQQLVTVAEDNRSPQGLWQIREAHDEGNIVPSACLTGAPVPCGKTIRLNHIVTGTNLHTHDIRSPLSNQQEVSGFGRDGSTDLGDDWIVVCNTGHWKRDTPMQLRSAATNRYLGASSSVKFTEQNCGRGCPILNHLELFGREVNDLYTQWKVELGVHLHK